MRAPLTLALLCAASCKMTSTPPTVRPDATPHVTDVTNAVVDAQPDVPVALPRAELMPRARLDEVMQPLVADGWFRGAVVGFIDARGAQIEGYGTTAGDGSPRPDGATVFEIGSITKTLTALALARDVVDGRVTLDAPVQSLLPQEARVPMGARAITLRDLVVHGSGLPRLPSNLNPRDNADPYADYAVEDLYDFLASHRLRREPGASFEYSNLGFGLLGHALARRATSSYEALLRTRVFDPLGMRGATITLTDAQRARSAAPCDADGNAVSPWNFTDAMAGAGAVRATMEDVLRYGAAMAGAAETDAPMRGAIERALQEEERWPGNPTAMAWVVTPEGLRWHNGGTGGFESMLVIDREQRRAVAVLANTITGWQVVTSLGLRLATTLRGETPRPWNLPRAVTLPAETLSRYAGVYRFEADNRVTLTVARDAGGLTARIIGQPAFRITPTGEADFFLRVVVARLHFELDGANPARRVRLDQDGRSQWAAR